MNPRPNIWRTGLLLTLTGVLWLDVLHRFEGYPGGVRLWLHAALVAVPLGLVGTAVAVWFGKHLSAGAHSDAARLVIWALTLAVTVAGALAGAGPLTATVFGEHTGTVPRDGVAAFLVLFPVALLNCALRRMHATRAASPVRRAARRGLPRHRLSE